MTAMDKYGRMILHALQAKPMNPKDLHSVLKLPNVASLSTHEIADFWKKLHKQRPFHVSMAMSKRHFENWLNRAKVHPKFIIPIMNGQRIENYFIEHRFSERLVEIGCCPLQEYKTKHMFAQSDLTVFAYSDLLSERDIALLVGSFRPEGNLNRISSQFLLVSISEVYCRLYDFVQQFNCSPNEFTYNSYLTAFNDMMQHMMKK